MQKIIRLLLTFICIMGLSNVWASEIPQGEKNVLEKTFPGIKIRFDGMLELKDGTKYIPVFPLRANLSDNPKVKMTLPKGKALSSKPDFFIFDTNLSFFKIISKNGKTTIISNSSIPQEVKMGLVPQDLLVPSGFQIPSEYRIMIGDLVIPVIQSSGYKETYISNGKTENKQTKSNKNTTPNTGKLSGKIFYTTSFNNQSLVALDATSGNPYKKIEFLSIPSDFKVVRNGHYMLLTTVSKPILYIIDADKCQVLKEIQVGKKPVSIAVSETNGVAYVANKGDGTISVINLKDMSVKETIDVLGNPSYLTLSYNEKQLYYLDGTTGTVYALVDTPNYFVPHLASPLFKTHNINQIQFFNDKLYTLNRASSELEVFYTVGKSKQKELLTLTYVKDEELKRSNEIIEKDENGNIVKRELTGKEKFNRAMDKLLRRNEEEPAPKTPIYEEVMVLQNDKLKMAQQQFSLDMDTTSIVEKQLTIDEEKNKENEKLVIKEAPEVKKQTTKEKFKDKFIDFITYKKPTEIQESQEIIRKRNEKMDFVELPKKSNAFLVLSDKIYILNSDEYKIYILDDNYETIKTIDLEKLGYYNDISLSLDGKQVLVTNISLKEINVVDLKSDKLIKKLPLKNNVHKVIMVDKDNRL